MVLKIESSNLSTHPIFYESPMNSGFFAIYKNKIEQDAGKGRGGDIALLIWCIYFIPVGVPAYRHFLKNGK